MDITFVGNSPCMNLKNSLKLLFYLKMGQRPCVKCDCKALTRWGCYDKACMSIVCFNLHSLCSNSKMITFSKNLYTPPEDPILHDPEMLKQ